MVSVPSNITAAPGETFTLPITVSAVSGLAGYYIELGYSDSLEFVRAQNGPLAAVWPVPVTHSLTGRCTLAGYGTSPITGPGTLVQVQLRVKPAAPLGHATTLYFRKVELNDGAIIASTQSGTVTVADIAVLGMPPSLDLLPGEEFILPIELRDAGGVLGFVFSLSYAPNLLDFLGTTPGTLPTGWGAPTVNTSIHGRLTIGTYGTQAFSGSATVINLRFRLREDAPLDQTTTLEIYSAELNDGALPVVYGSTLIRTVSEHPMPLGPPVWIILIVLLGYMILRHSRHLRKSPHLRHSREGTLFRHSREGGNPGFKVFLLWVSPACFHTRHSSESTLSSSFPQKPTSSSFPRRRESRIQSIYSLDSRLRGNDGEGIVPYSREEDGVVCEHPLQTSQKRILECWNSPQTGFRKKQSQCTRAWLPAFLLRFPSYGGQAAGRTIGRYAMNKSSHWLWDAARNQRQR